MSYPVLPEVQFAWPMEVKPRWQVTILIPSNLLKALEELGLRSQNRVRTVTGVCVGVESGDENIYV